MALKQRLQTMMPTFGCVCCSYERNCNAACPRIIVIPCFSEKDGWAVIFTTSWSSSGSDIGTGMFAIREQLGRIGHKRGTMYNHSSRISFMFFLKTKKTRLLRFYRAKLRVARYCQGKLYVCPSVRDVEVSWSYWLEFCQNNFTAD